MSFWSTFKKIFQSDYNLGKSAPSFCFGGKPTIRSLSPSKPFSPPANGHSYTIDELKLIIESHKNNIDKARK